MRPGTGAAHTSPVTTAPTRDPELRTRFGTPRRWTGAGCFAVLMSSSEEVVDRIYDSATDSWSKLEHVDDAHDHAVVLRRAQPGVEFEVVRLEGGVWRDYLGRTVRQIIDARWGAGS